MLIRRVVPAIIATWAVYTGLALVAANLLRHHYLTPLVITNVNVPGSAWIMSQWWIKGGRFAFTDWRDASEQPPACNTAASSPGRAPRQADGRQTLAQCFAQHGYTHFDQVSNGQPVLAVPVDRGRLAAWAVGAAHRRDRVGGRRGAV